MKTSYFYSFLCSILLGATLISFHYTAAYAAAGDPPAITITSPAANQITNTPAISGTYTDDNIPSSDLLFTAYDNGKKISDSAANANEWKITDDGTVKTWSYTAKSFTEGSHDFLVNIVENVNPVNTTAGSARLIFTMDTKRPTIISTKIIIPGQTEQVMAGSEDFTRVPLNAKIRITIVDQNPMTNFSSDPIKLILNSQEKNGDITIQPKGQIDGKYQYEITFAPKDSDPLVLNKTYLVYTNPLLADNAGNPVFARFFKFTTTSDTGWGDRTKADNPNNPHGNYSLKTNMCASCHSTHIKSHMPDADQAGSREGGTYLLTFNDQLLQKSSESYCMACHDGTMNNAPIIDKIDTTSHHTSDLKEAASCTSCHNPHLEWTESNQNLLKDHLIYTHTPADVGKKQRSGEALTNGTLTIDSLDQPCDSCHGSNEINRSVPADSYKALSYKKAASALGKEDYSLCLRCHNTAKKAIDPTLADIDQYYNDPASGHYFSLDGGPVQPDGSPLNGPIPCADCHETHGSNNIKMLRATLGNVQTADQFTTSAPAWNAADERSFCLKCHNNDPKTAIYGQVGIFKEQNNSQQPIAGHQPGDTQACYSCHGTGTTDSEKALSSAHAPKKLPAP